MARRPWRLPPPGPFLSHPFICPAMPQKTHVNAANQRYLTHKFCRRSLFPYEVTDAGLANVKGMTELQSLGLGVHQGY